ncbi:MAG TPA: DNA-binding protein, partial [Acidimicrobiia bacterium]|nr:DNA-binding protein [Acidimicrobiia bacterium]
MIHSIGTALPAWSAGGVRIVGDDEDVVTLAVAAGRAALGATPTDAVTTVVFVSRDFPLLEGGNSAPLLAGLDLPDHVDVREQLGGGPAALQAVADAAAGTLVIGADTGGAAGAAAVLCTDEGAAVSMVGRVTRSLPVATRAPTGATTDYADPRLLRVLGVGASLAELDLGQLVAVAGVSPKDAQAIAGGAVPALPATGASAPLFALAAVAEQGASGTVLAIEQATVVAVDLG